MSLGSVILIFLHGLSTTFCFFCFFVDEVDVSESISISLSVSNNFISFSNLGLEVVNFFFLSTTFCFFCFFVDEVDVSESISISLSVSNNFISFSNLGLEVVNFFFSSIIFEMTSLIGSKMGNFKNFTASRKSLMSSLLSIQVLSNLIFN